MFECVVQLLLPLWFCSNVWPNKTGTFRWCGTASGNTHSTHIVSRTPVGFYVLLLLLACSVLHYAIRNSQTSHTPTYSLALPPYDSVGVLYYRRHFFSVHFLLSSSLNLHLPYILFNIFLPSHSRSSHSSPSSRFPLKYFINSLSVIHSCYTSIPVSSF